MQMWVNRADAQAAVTAGAAGPDPAQFRQL